MSRSQAPLIVHVIFSLKSGGLENGLINIINRTPSTRYRHAIICLTESGSFARRIFDPSVQVISLHKKEGHDLGLYYRFWKTVRRLKPVVVHTRNLATLEMQIIAFLIPGVKRVHGEHGRDINDLDGSNRKYALIRKVMRPFVQRYIAVSQDLNQWLSGPINIKPDKLVQIYNGVDTEIFYPREDSQRPKANLDVADNATVVGTVGRLAEVKNQLLLIDAIHLLVKKSPAMMQSLKVVVVGDGPLRQAVEQRIRQSGLDKIVWLTGDRDDVPELLRQMDIFILPSLAEGISNTILEAMASGVPVIATNVGGTPELIENRVNGLLVPNGNADAMAEAIAELMDNPGLRTSLAYQALERVRNRFNWQSTVERYLQVYDRLLA